MSIITKRIIRDAVDVDLAIVGAVDETGMSEIIIRPSEFADAKALKLTALFHAVQTGLLLLLYWEGEDEHTLLMPVEGRGILDLTRFGGLENPRFPGWTGNILLKAEPATRLAHFALTFEFSKQRS